MRAVYIRERRLRWVGSASGLALGRVDTVVRPVHSPARPTPAVCRRLTPVSVSSGSGIENQAQR